MKKMNQTKSLPMLEAALQALAEPEMSKRIHAQKLADALALIAQLPLVNMEVWEFIIRAEYQPPCAADRSIFWRLLHREPPLTWFDMVGADGHRREAFLRQLEQPAPNAFFFLLALRRLNDWVPEVRQAARERLVALARVTPPDTVFQALSASLVNWQSWQRMEQADQAVLLEVMGLDAVAQRLRALLASSPAGPMPSLFGQLGRSDILDAHLENIARCARQPAVRAIACRSLLEQRIRWIETRQRKWVDLASLKSKNAVVFAERSLTVQTPWLALWRMAAADPAAMVRNVAAEYLVREFERMGPQASELAQELAQDASPAVAGRGRFVLQRLAETQVLKGV